MICAAGNTVFQFADFKSRIRSLNLAICAINGGANGFFGKLGIFAVGLGLFVHFAELRGEGFDAKLKRPLVPFVPYPLKFLERFLHDR